MRFVVANLICLLLVITGCFFSKHSSELEKNTPQSDTNKVDVLDVTSEVNKSNSLNSDNKIDIDDADRHFRKFFTLVSTDLEEASSELSKYVEIRFEGHTLADEWKQLTLRLAREQKGTLPDLQRSMELHIQMLTDVDLKKYAKSIEKLQQGLKQTKALGEMLKSRGIDIETYEMEGKFVAP
ncbi:MAG: hypothetical protein OXU23_17035 [Candidatus Poribacteria bacterium]|nr:hypothetical protein [Candidatus Poribacteria bacterium]